MHREGHHGLNALLYAPIALGVSYFASIELAIIGALLFVGLSSIPDFDRHFDNNMNSSRSEIWKIVPIKHRGFTHTVWFVGLMGVVGGGFGSLVVVEMIPYHSPEVVAVFCGFMAAGGVGGHILGDAMTPMGVKPFTPVRKKPYTLDWFLASSPIANYGFLLIGGVALLSVFGYVFSVTGPELGDYTGMIHWMVG